VFFFEQMTATITFIGLGNTRIGFDVDINKCKPLIGNEKEAGLFPPELKIPINTKLGDVLTQNLSKEALDYLNGCSLVAINPYRILKDFWEPIKEDTRICVKILVPFNQMMEVPLRMWQQKRRWPPCSNYGKQEDGSMGVEPITMIPIGDDGMDSHHDQCEICRGKEYMEDHDNQPKNMIVINKIGYNKWALLNCIKAKLKVGLKPRDPITQQPFSIHHIPFIINGSHYDLIEL
jgi:hypothetical protein